MRLGFFLREALRSMSRNAVPSFAAMASVLVTLLVLGVFIPIVQATTGAANDVRNRVLVNVYLDTNASTADAERVRDRIEHGVPYVGHVQFVSKRAAYAEQRRRFPDAYQLLGRNPLPDTFRITPDKPDNALKLRDALSPQTPGGGRTTLDPAIDEVKNSKDETEKILVATRVVKITTGLLAVLLVIASVLLISNTIRLSLYARRREIEVMKLVGATDWFIRWPFVIEGVVLGALGGLVAILLLLVGKIALLDPLIDQFALLAAPDTINLGVLVAVLLVAAVAVSALGSGLSLRRSPLPAVIGLCVVLLVAGIWVGGRHSSWLPGPVRSALVGDEDTAVVEEAINDVAHTYYRGIPRDRLANDAIDGVVRGLDDRFSAYFDPQDYRRFKQSQNSEFSGVGVQVSQHPRGLRVEVVYDDSPAKRAGIGVGDVITRADGRSLGGRKQEDAISLVKGPPGSDVRLTWVHDGRATTKQVTRSTVSVPVVASSLRREAPCKVGVVRLATFSSGAHAEVYTALRRLHDRGARAYVLDLRDNGGGLVNEAQLVASAFLDEGPVVTTRGRAVQERTLRATGSPVIPDAPMTVLVDNGTASASEIVAGALQDRHRATVVGTKTFGKGVFQQVLELSNGGALDITAGQYFTPSGRNLGGRGVSRGSGIEPAVRAADDPDTPRDEGLARAAAVAAAKCR